MGATLATRATSILLVGIIFALGYHLGATNCGAVGQHALERVLALAWQALPLIVIWGLLVYGAALLVLDVGKRF